MRVGSGIGRSLGPGGAFCNRDCGAIPTGTPGGPAAVRRTPPAASTAGRPAGAGRRTPRGRSRRPSPTGVGARRQATQRRARPPSRARGSAKPQTARGSRTSPTCSSEVKRHEGDRGLRAPARAGRAPRPTIQAASSRCDRQSRRASQKIADEPWRELEVPGEGHDRTAMPTARSHVTSGLGLPDGERPQEGHRQHPGGEERGTAWPEPNERRDGRRDQQRLPRSAAATSYGRRASGRNRIARSGG